MAQGDNAGLPEVSMLKWPPLPLPVCCACADDCCAPVVELRGACSLVESWQDGGICAPAESGDVCDVCASDVLSMCVTALSDAAAPRCDEILGCGILLREE